jgi:hypothetical protein
VQGERLESQHLARVLFRDESETVADEQKVELSSFARVSDRLEDRKVLAAGSSSRDPPAGDMISRAHSVNAEIHLPARVHFWFRPLETRLPTLSRANTHRAAGDIDDILLDAIEFGNQRIELRAIDRMTINPLRLVTPATRAKVKLDYLPAGKSRAALMTTIVAS